MELKIYDKILVLENPHKAAVFKNKIKVNINYPLSKYQRYIKIDDMPYVEIKEDFVIPPEVRDNKEIRFTLKVMNKETLSTQVFKTDPIKAERLLYLGNTEKEQYPETLGNLVKRLTELERKVKLIAESVVEIGKKGEWL